MRNLDMPSAARPREVRYSRARAPSGERSWSSNRALAVLGGFFGGGEFAFGQGDAGFLGDGADGFGEAAVFDFLDEGEDVSMLVAAKAIEELASGVDAEGGSFLFVEGTEAGVVLGAGFFEADVFADDFDDV